jgi:hypothetical protein
MFQNNCRNEEITWISRNEAALLKSLGTKLLCWNWNSCMCIYKDQANHRLYKCLPSVGELLGTEKLPVLQSRKIWQRTDIDPCLLSRAGLLWVWALSLSLSLSLSLRQQSRPHQDLSPDAKITRSGETATSSSSRRLHERLCVRLWWHYICLDESCNVVLRTPYDRYCSASCCCHDVYEYMSCWGIQENLSPSKRQV